MADNLKERKKTIIYCSTNYYYQKENLMKTNSWHPNIIKRIIKIPVTKRVRSFFYHVILFVAICCTIMSFIYNVPNPIQVITCNKLITDHNAITQRNISHVTWHHGEEICPDCSLPDCHIACLPKTFGGNPVKSNEKLFLHIIFC